MKRSTRWLCAVALGVLAPAGESLAAEIDVVGLTIEDILAGYQAKQFTAVELTQAYLNQIETYEPVYNAWITIDAAGALARAAEIDAIMELNPAAATGALFGVPIAIKDPMDVAGLPTTGGSSALSSKTGGFDIIPEFDSPIVARIRAAGAIILGKTNIPDWSRSGTNSTSTVEGATLNAYDITRVPGGSSGGSGVAVATGMAPVGTAEETGSSITNPASASSLVGMRPTFGLIPSAGVMPGQGTFRDVMGPLTKTVRDTARMMDVLSGPTAEDPKTLVSVGKLPDGGYLANLEPGKLSGAKFAVYGPGWNNVTLTQETQDLFNGELAVLESLGATLIDDPFVGTGWEELRSGIPSSNTFSYDINAYFARLGPNAEYNSVEEFNAKTGLDWYSLPNQRAASSEADPIARADLDDYLKRRAELRALFNKILDENGLDGIVMPQLAAPVPTLESGDGISRTPGAAVNVMGIPGIVVPGGYYSDGTPFAMYFIGRQWDELDLLNFAYDYEQATMHRVAPVLIPEPTTALLAALGMGAIVTQRRRAA